MCKGRGLSPSAGTGQQDEESIWPLGADCQLPHSSSSPPFSLVLSVSTAVGYCTLQAPWGPGLQSQMQALTSPACVLTFLAPSFSQPASVPLNCRGWLLYSKGPSYRSTPLTLQGSGCSDAGTLGHTRGSICLPLKHTERYIFKKSFGIQMLDNRVLKVQPSH